MSPLTGLSCGAGPEHAKSWREPALASLFLAAVDSVRHSRTALFRSLALFLLLSRSRKQRKQLPNMKENFEKQSTSYTPRPFARARLEIEKSFHLHVMNSNAGPIA